MGDGADGQDQLQTFYCPFQAIATVEEEEGRDWEGLGGGGRLLFGSFIQLIFVKIRSSKTSSILLLPIVCYSNNCQLKKNGKNSIYHLLNNY